MSYSLCVSVHPWDTGHGVVYVGHPHEVASPHACKKVYNKFLPTTVTQRRYRHMEIHSPVAHPAPPRIRSPAVPSTNQCEGKEAEESRQQLASRCTIQLVNVALLLTSVLLRRMISKAEPRAGDSAEETIAQKVERHTGVLFTRVHARYFFEVVATSLGIPCPVLDTVLGVTNSAGATNDGQGLLLVEKLLHGALHGAQPVAADHEVAQPDQGRFFNLAPAPDPIYGPLMTPVDNDEPIKWNTTRRGSPNNCYPVVLHVGMIEGGRVPTLGGLFTTGFSVDLSQISVEFIAAALVGIADGSARRGGEGWGDLPQSVDYPSALLTQDPSSQQPSIETIARSIMDLTKKFYTMYVPVTTSAHGIFMAKGDYAGSMSVLVASAHIAAGKEATRGRLLPPSSAFIPSLVALYSRYRRRDGPGDWRAPSLDENGAGVGLFGPRRGSRAPEEAASGSSAGAGDRDGPPVQPSHLVELEPNSRRNLKRKCVEEGMPTVHASDGRGRQILAKLGFIPMMPTRTNVAKFLDTVVESAISETLEQARARGQVEVQRIVKVLNEQLEQVKLQRDQFKEKKQEFSEQLVQLKHVLRQAQEDLDAANANSRVAPGMGATDTSVFQVELAESRRQCKDLQQENEELARCHQNARRAQQDVQLMMERLRDTSAFETEAHRARVSVMQGTLDAQTEQL